MYCLLIAHRLPIIWVLLLFLLQGLERSVSNLEKSIAKEKEAIATLADEITALQEGIVSLDKSVAEAIHIYIYMY